MKKLLSHTALLAVLLSANASADSRPTDSPVATCTFSKSRPPGYGNGQDRGQGPGQGPGYGSECVARASICLNASQAPRSTDRCGQRLELTCDGATVFSGEWSADSLSNPERYHITGIPSHEYPIEPFIEILANPSENFPARLIAHDIRLTGTCVLPYPSVFIAQ